MGTFAARYTEDMALLRNVGTTLEMIKWEHSIFALPFALSGAMLAAGGWPAWSKLFWIVVCMVTARSAAMAFNRWADARLDAANPRTAARAIPAGLLSRNFVGGFTVVMAVAFVLAAAQLNRVTLLLSPVALACHPALLLHQAVHPLVSPGAGSGAGNCARGCLDRNPRLP